MVRDRLSALLAAARRQQLVAALRSAEHCVVRRRDTTWVIDGARLIDTSIRGAAGRALPVDPPDPPAPDRPVDRRQIDEALCLAKYFDKHAHQLEVVSCSGDGRFPLALGDDMPRLALPSGSSAMDHPVSWSESVTSAESAASSSPDTVVTTAPS